MAFFLRSIRTNRFCSFLRHRNPSALPSTNRSFHLPNSRHFVSRVSPFSSGFCRRISSATAQEIAADVSDHGSETESKSSLSAKSAEITPKKRKPLDLFYKGVVGLIEKTEESVLSEEELDDDSKSKGISEMSKKLRDLEREVKNLISEANARKTEKKGGVGAVEAKPNRLYSLFAKTSPPGAGSVRVEGRILAPEALSLEMVSFLDRLFKEGYLAEGIFLKDGQLNLSCLSSSFSQDYLKFAAEKFGEDHQETAKWLSGSDLKRVALFGCPSVERKTVFAAKRLRSFFSIHEDTACQACQLKSSCKFANQRVTKRRKLMAADALRVLTVYGLALVPQRFVITDEIKASVGKLLKQTVNLSK